MDLTSYSPEMLKELLDSDMDSFDRKQLMEIIAALTPEWEPLDGPQRMAYESEADIIGYGGAAGGGKTDLICGMALTKHKRSLIVRREKAQTEGIIQRITEIRESTDGFNSQKAIWKIDNQRLMEFAGLDNPGDERRWQGRPHDLKCVGRGTLVWMADGSKKPVEEIEVGDTVDTLEGPRKVTRTFVSSRPSVRITTHDGHSQVQGSTHCLLTPYGWVSFYPHHSGFALPTALNARHISDVLYEPTCSMSARPLVNPPKGQTRTTKYARCPEGNLSLLGSYAGKARRVLGICYEALSGISPKLSQSVLSHLIQIASAWSCPRQAVSWTVKLFALRGGCGVRAGSSLPDSSGDCLYGSHHSDEPHSLLGADHHKCPHPQGGAARQNPIYLLDGGARHTPKHSRRKWSYAHPYTKETRQTDRPVRVVFSSVEGLGVQTLYDLTVEGSNHYMTGAGFVNRNCFDEVTEQREAQVRFVMGWLRSPDPTLKCKVLMTFNPPTTTEGRWILDYFAPWLTKNHPRPAKPGELRWFTTEDGKDVEVPDNRPYVRLNGQREYDFDPLEHKEEEIIRPKSRTFIPARVTDNPFYMTSGYMSTLQALPEPLRSQMLNGDFLAGIEDDIWQLLPTRWVEEAQKRWKDRYPKPPMDSLGCDVARGGKDNSLWVARHGMWFDKPIKVAGKDTPDGPEVAGRTVALVRDGAPIHIDVIGVGASPYDFLNKAKQHVIPVDVRKSVTAKDQSGALDFFNLRTCIAWQFREALDPANNTGIEIPPGEDILRELCSIQWSISGRTIKVESREDIIKRLGYSPDTASGFFLANIQTPKLHEYRPAAKKIAERNSYDPYENLTAVSRGEYDPFKNL